MTLSGGVEVFTGRGLAVWRAGLEADVYSGSGLTTLLSAPLSYVELLGLAPGNPSQNKLFPPGGGVYFCQLSCYRKVTNLPRIPLKLQRPRPDKNSTAEAVCRGQGHRPEVSGTYLFPSLVAWHVTIWCTHVPWLVMKPPTPVP